MSDKTRAQTISTLNISAKEPGLLTRAWRSYQYKLRTDQTFRATMMAIQLMMVGIIVVAAILLIIRDQSLSGSFLPNSLR